VPPHESAAPNFFIRGDALSVAAVFRKGLIQNFLAIVETGALQAINGVCEGETIAPRGDGENGERSRHSESPAARGFCGATLVDEKQIGVKLHGE
jgi:hypothetical protein